MSAALFRATNFESFRDGHQDFGENGRAMSRRRFISASGAALIVGGASILLGLKPKLGTLAIMGFLAGVSPSMHDFWHDEDPNQRMNNLSGATGKPSIHLRCGRLGDVFQLTLVGRGVIIGGSGWI